MCFVWMTYHLFPDNIWSKPGVSSRVLMQRWQMSWVQWCQSGDPHQSRTLGADMELCVNVMITSNVCLEFNITIMICRNWKQNVALWKTFYSSVQSLFYWGLFPWIMSAFTLRMLDARVRMRLEKNICKFYCTRNLAIFSSLTRLVGNLPTANQFPTVSKFHFFWKFIVYFFHFKGIELEILVLIYVKSFSSNFCLKFIGFFHEFGRLFH